MKRDENVSREEFNRLALKQKQALPLEGKVILAQQRIREWYEHWDGQVYVSFSGGKDSTVLLHLVRDLYPDVPAVFVDTGLEFPEIRKFAMSQPNVTVIRPEMRFDQVIDKYGYPVASKEQAAFVQEYRTTRSEKLKNIRLSGNKWGRGKISKRWIPLTTAPFDVSDKCCDVMKKKPAKQYEKETGRHPFVGTMACESDQRASNWMMYGCNAFNKKRPTSQPLSIWKDGDVWDYLSRYNVEYASVYDLGYDRTGCMFCMFGCHLEKAPNRFQKMKETHPRQYDYCMRSRDEKGLGLREVLEYIGVEYE